MRGPIRPRRQRRLTAPFGTRYSQPDRTQAVWAGLTISISCDRLSQRNER